MNSRRAFISVHRFVPCLIALLWPLAAQAESGVCSTAASEIEASLRGFQPPAEVTHPGQRISISNAAAQRPAAGLDFGAKLEEPSLNSFLLTQEERASFENALRYIHRAGGATGLVLLDAVAGTAYCHSPLLFTSNSGSLKPLKAPAPSEPFELCVYGGVALGAADGTPFYAQRHDDYLETDWLKIFPLKDGALSEACTITAHYAIVFETAGSFCGEPGLCADYAAKAAEWARQFRTADGRIEDAALTRLEEVPAVKPDPADFPLFGAPESKLAPQPFQFDSSEAWFALAGDPRAGLLHIGPAKEGPMMMANWDSFTLAVLYKDGQPAASFVVERRRGAFQSLTVETAGQQPPEGGDTK